MVDVVAIPRPLIEPVMRSVATAPLIATNSAALRASAPFSESRH